MSRKRNTPLSIAAHDSEDHRRKSWKKNFVVSSSEDSEPQNTSEDGYSENEEGEWDIKCILDESKTHYLIDWEGPWTPTWVSFERRVEFFGYNTGRLSDTIYLGTGAEGERQRRRNQCLGEQEEPEGKEERQTAKRTIESVTGRPYGFIDQYPEPAIAAQKPSS